MIHDSVLLLEQILCHPIIEAVLKSEALMAGIIFNLASWRDAV